MPRAQEGGILCHFLSSYRGTEGSHAEAELGQRSSRWARAKRWASFPSYLANDMEEDEEDDEPPKQAILSFLFGKDDAQRPLFDHLRLQFMRCMGWKAWVTLEECEEVGEAGAA